MRLRCDVSTLDRKHAVYQVDAVWTNPDERKTMVIGCCPIDDVFRLREARRLAQWEKDMASADAAEILVLALHDTAEEAEKTGRAIHTVLNPDYPFLVPTFDRKIGPRAVRCIETGQTFETQSAAARYHNCDMSALSRHLAGQKGFRTVAGFTFERIER